MANLTSRWIDAISVLNDLTQSEKVKWQVEKWKTEKSTGPLIGSGSILTIQQDPSAVYRAKYMDKWFRIKKYGEPTGIFGLSSNQRYSLEIIDDAGNTLFVVPEQTGLSDLFSSIQYQLSGVDALLTSLLSHRGPN